MGQRVVSWPNAKHNNDEDDFMSQPPVRTEYAAFTAHGSRHREFMVTSISSGFHRVHGVQLARSLSTVYRFPTLCLRALPKPAGSPPLTRLQNRT
jgi:hypothetical protein